ncbi:hypothetical protein [Roseicella aquatilis]|uniref:Uncharacterized protein n=1 Tax=Roseicella aquatilis TaxID=2527868 RepID=A0A4R4DCJ1_9PROT|nr:hypothetical protein [Roseicella aquatilis]TCZ57838.1 hypothetical protein EXY23_17915 [Roseicella aquatilis]
MTLFRRTALASGLGLLLAPTALAQGGGGGGGGGGASGGAAGGAGAGGMGGGMTGGGAMGGVTGGAQPGMPPAGGGSATSGAAGTAAGQAGAQGQQGTGLQGRRDTLEQQQRAAGVATPPEREVQQLRDLNAMSKQLAPNAPLPAPEVGTPRR